MIYAYLDPGVGHLLIQAVIASVLAAPVVLRTWLREMIGRIRRLD